MSDILFSNQFPENAQITNLKTSDSDSGSDKSHDLFLDFSKKKRKRNLENPVLVSRIRILIRINLSAEGLSIARVIVWVSRVDCCRAMESRGKEVPEGRLVPSPMKHLQLPIAQNPVLTLTSFGTEYKLNGSNWE